MRIALISRDNGAGLSTDMGLLSDFFTSTGHKVNTVDWRANRMDPCDIAFFLELFNPRLTRYARHTVGIFNLEWFDNRWWRYLRVFKQLWAKSREAEEVYRSLGLHNVHYTGFLSRQIHDPAVPRELRVLHVAGHSKLKNTETVLELWRSHGGALAPRQLPPLTVVASWDVGPVPDGVTVLGRIPQDELYRLMNSHQIHLCPSRAEGWGHYITEGLSTGALVVTTDRSPMNEHSPHSSILVPAATSARRGRVLEHHIDPRVLFRALGQAVDMAQLSPEAAATMGAIGRQRIEERNNGFRSIATGLLRQLR